MKKKLTLFVCAFMFVACSNNEPSSIFDNYLYRLQNALDVSDDFIERQSVSTAPIASLPRYPQRRDLLQTIPPININLIDFLRLSSCDLQRHVGQRNSSLGKLMKPSQQLLYEYEFIRLAKLCQQELAEGTELYSILSRAIKEKEDHLAAAQANAIFASDEFKTFFSLGAKALSIESLKASPQTLSSALDMLSRFVQQAPSSTVQIEDAYAVMGSSKRMGEVRRSMVLVQHYLAQADTLLNYRIDHNPLCHKSNARPVSKALRNPQIEVMNTVFMKFYIGDIQPYLAALHQYAKPLLLQIEALHQQQQSPPAFDRFWAAVYSDEVSEWQQFTDAVKKHTRHWQSLLRQCGLLPE